MIAKLLRFALQQRFVTIVLSLALIGLGVWSFLQLKVEAYPDISDTQVVVVTLYPGRAAEEVEQQVTLPIERALNSVPQVIARRSRTIFGLSVVELTGAADRLSNDTAKPLAVFGGAMIAYLLLTLPSGYVVGRIERRVAFKR